MAARPAWAWRVPGLPDGVSEAVTAPHPDPRNFMPSAGPGWGPGGLGGGLWVVSGDAG